VPKTSSKPCDQAIFIDQAIGASVSSDAALVEIDRFGQRFQRRRRAGSGADRDESTQATIEAVFVTRRTE
jgi:hypothetical protein